MRNRGLHNRLANSARSSFFRLERSQEALNRCAIDDILHSSARFKALLLQKRALAYRPMGIFYYARKHHELSQYAGHAVPTAIAHDVSV
jgi:hypothetical protein